MSVELRSIDLSGLMEDHAFTDRSVFDGTIDWIDTSACVQEVHAVSESSIAAAWRPSTYDPDRIAAHYLSDRAVNPQQHA